MKLPLEALLDLFSDAGSAAMTQNFALVYVEMAFKRASPSARFALVSATTAPGRVAVIFAYYMMERTSDL